MSSTTFPELLTVAQLAEFFGVSRSAAYRLSRRLRSYRAPGVGLRFRRSDAEAYLEAHGRDPGAAVHPIRRRGTRVASAGDDLDAEVLPGLTRRQLREQARST